MNEMNGWVDGGWGVGRERREMSERHIKRHTTHT
jgi:hypothetical protein